MLNFDFIKRKKLEQTVADLVKDNLAMQEVIKSLGDDIKTLSTAVNFLKENDQILVNVINTALHKERDSITQIDDVEYHEIKDE